MRIRSTAGDIFRSNITVADIKKSVRLDMLRINDSTDDSDMDSDCPENYLKMEPVVLVGERYIEEDGWDEYLAKIEAEKIRDELCKIVSGIDGLAVDLSERPMRHEIIQHAETYYPKHVREKVEAGKEVWVLGALVKFNTELEIKRQERLLKQLQTEGRIK